MFDGPRFIRLSQARAGKTLRVRVLRLFLVCSAVFCLGQSDFVSHFSAVMPLGSDSILLQPSKQRLNMLLTVESPEFERIRTQGTGHQRTVTYDDGDPVHYYPSQISFRFTIGSRTATDETQPNDVDTTVDADRFQSTLRFRLKVFHGIEAKTLEPVEVKMLGVPAEVPFDERIYHFTFKLKNVPVEDRMMLEILDENGNRVGKFHLQIL